MKFRITARFADIVSCLLLTTLCTSAAPAPGSVIALVDGRNQQWVSADNGTSSENLLVANVANVTDWERFVVVDAGNGQIGLRCQANNQYVCAEGAGTATLRANRSALNSWEKFTWIDNADGSASLVANANGKYVSSQAEGLIANRTAINAWEKFSVLNPSTVDGFASVPALGLSGTTGGTGGQTVTVTTRAQLISYGTDNTPRILQIPEGTVIDLTNGTFSTGTKTVGRYNGVYYCGEISNVITSNGGVSLGSNKTVVGLGNGASLIGAGLAISGKSNVIVSNLTISDVNQGVVEAGDGITIDSSHHVWVDHCTFRNISDGHIDINGTNPRYITVSWCHFDGYDLGFCSPHQHNYVSGIGSGAMVTIHHCYFDRGGGRNPRVSGTGTMVHGYNNYYRNVSFYCVASEENAQTRLDRCYFENSQRPHYYDWDLSSSAGAGALQTTVADNIYTGASATSRRETGGTVFNPASYYNYQPQPASEVPAAVLAGAGAGNP